MDTLFHNRRQAELDMLKGDIGELTSLLSTNLKTGVSVNFPVSQTCQPSKTCMAICYACKPNGFMMMDAPLKRSLQMYEYFQKTPTAIVADRLAKEYLKAQKKMGLKVLRWNGVGDLFEESVAVINYMSQYYPEINHLIYSRKVDMINKIREADNISVCISLDQHTVDKMKKITRKVVTTYLRENADDMPDFPIDIVFPAHQNHKNIPATDNDCPCDRKIIPTKNACVGCGRCFNPLIKVKFTDGKVEFIKESNNESEILQGKSTNTCQIAT